MCINTVICDLEYDHQKSIRRVCCSLQNRTPASLQMSMRNCIFFFIASMCASGLATLI